MLMPGAAIALVFTYLPMYGLVIAFKEYVSWKGIWGSPWVGLDQFRLMLTYPGSMQVIENTVVISLFKIVFGIAVPLAFALLLNEVRQIWLKKTVQTLVYLPYFLSWIILSGILLDLLSSGGLVNQFLNAVFGIQPVPFLSDGNWFRFTLVTSHIWKEFGISSIIFLAALTGIDPSLYESAEIDGAGRWKQTLHITLPGVLPVTVVVLILSLGYIFEGGFDQVFNMYNPLVYDKGDIIDTFVYRMAFENGNFSFATAVGLSKSLVELAIVGIAYIFAHRVGNYRIF